MTKLSEAERDGAAAGRQILALKNTIERLNKVGVVLFYSCLYCVVLLDGCLKKLMLQLLIQKNVREIEGLNVLRWSASCVWKWGIYLQHPDTFCVCGADYCTAHTCVIFIY